MTTSRAIVVTGASGYIGGLIAAALLARRDQRLILPIRQKHDPEALRRAIFAGAAALEPDLPPDAIDRLIVAPLPRAYEAERLLPELEAALRPFDVEAIFHSAGCLSYFHVERLREGNEALTRRFLELGHRLGGARFVYVSTAYASGYVDGEIGESLHDEPAADPNEYTRSKRATERLVAESGLPAWIVRPSIVVGDSVDGRYSGKPYGAYQVWSGLCKFLCDEYRPVIHAVAPEVPLNFVHQDAVQSGLLAAYEHLPAGSIVHLVSRDAVVPTTREYWHLWMRACGRPREVRYYDDLGALDREALDGPQRLLIDFAEANIEISTHRWRFATAQLDRLRAAGLVDYRDATVETMEGCLRWFLARQPRAQEYMARTADLGVEPRIVRVGRKPLANAS